MFRGPRISDSRFASKELGGTTHLELADVGTCEFIFMFCVTISYVARAVCVAAYGSLREFMAHECLKVDIFLHGNSRELGVRRTR